MALILSNPTTTQTSNPKCRDIKIITDHLNTVRFINDSKSSIDQEPRILKMNGRALYQWIIKLIDQSQARLHYTKSHTNKLDTHSILNTEADRYASIAHKHLNKLPFAPNPTFTMDEYTLYQKGMSWIESNTKHFIDNIMSCTTSTNLFFKGNYRMLTLLYKTTNNPEYLYLRSSAAYTALNQLYTRSRQLATANKIHKRKPDELDSDLCQFGCNDIETPHHLFITCDHFSNLRTSTLQHLVQSMEKCLQTNDVHPNLIQQLLRCVKSKGELGFKSHTPGRGGGASRRPKIFFGT
jgi:hypothetical protein